MAGSDEKQTSASSSISSPAPASTSTSAPDSTAATTASTPSTKIPPTAGNSGGASAEFEPPLACVRRILKNTLPVNTNVGKDASNAFSRACGIFVIYLTACANDFARESKRQTITAADVMAAIKEVDFDEFTPQLTEFLEMHRKQEKIKRELKKSNEASAKKKRKDSIEAEAEAEAEASDNDNDNEDGDGDGDDQSQDNDNDNDNDDLSLATPKAKRLKLNESVDRQDDERKFDDEMETLVKAAYSNDNDNDNGSDGDGDGDGDESVSENDDGDDDDDDEDEKSES